MSMPPEGSDRPAAGNASAAVHGARDPEIRPAPTRDDLGRWAADHMWFPFSRPGEVNGEPTATILAAGDGSWIRRDDGKRLLDGVGAMEAMAVGHGEQRLIDAATKQLRELSFVDTFRYATEAAIQLARKLAELAPPSLNRVHFTPGGSEAVEVALKIAAQYHYLRGHRGRRRVVTRHGAFHGVTYGAMNCDGGYHATRPEIYLGDDRFGIAAPPADESTAWGPGAQYSSGASEIRRAVEDADPRQVAAVIVDGASSASGVAVPPAEDLREIRALCDQHGILLIVDEVITGFCRTGEWFISTKYGVEPDLMPISKAMSSGYMPIGGTMVSDKIVELFLESPPGDSVLSHGQTFAAHPVACAVSLENIRVMEERDFCTRATRQGEALRGKLGGLADHPCFVDVRGVGMVNGVELRARPGSAFPDDRAAVAWLRRHLRDAGLILIPIHPGTVMLVTPPITASQEEFDVMARLMREGLDALMEASA
jgi:adenosylmethionine-8-amino-7-oxononanoate aminotransferase